MQLKLNDDSIDLTDLLINASRALIAISAKSIAKIEDQVTLSQYRILIILISEGDQTPTLLSKMLNLKPYVVTRLCDQLLEKTLINRAPSGEDRRKISVSITPKGEHLVEKVIKIRKKSLQDIVEKIPLEQRIYVEHGFKIFAEISSDVLTEQFISSWII
ncbi:MAG: MarR family transcriptional regulator [Actinobacteria bacterium]|nr:MarR family transcriptional regulator [Actinomycetota bacterium]